MWRRRDQEPEAAGKDNEPPAPAQPSTPPPPATEVTAPPEDDPYAQLEHFFENPIVLEDIGTPQGAADAPGASESAAAGGTSDADSATLSDTIGRLEQFAQRLAARFEALEGKVEGGSAQTLEALRRLGERLGAELAMLDKRTVNLELTMARLRSTTEALESSLRKLPDYRPEPPADKVLPETPAPAATPSDTSSAAGGFAIPAEPVLEQTSPDPSPRPDALFTLEEEVPPGDWDESPAEDDPPPDSAWP